MGSVLIFILTPSSKLRDHIRHLVLPILTAAPPSSTYTHGGLPPRHLAFHFPTTSGIPQALPLSHLATSAPSCFHFPTTSGLPQALPLSHLATSAPSCFLLSNPVRSSSGTPSFEVHEQVLPNVPLGYGGVNSTYLTLRLGYNTASLTLGSGGRSLTPGVGYRRPEPKVIFNTLRAHLTLGQGNAYLRLRRPEPHVWRCVKAART